MTSRPIPDDDDDFDTNSLLLLSVKYAPSPNRFESVSTLRWERFQRACTAYDIQPMTIPLYITVRWNSTFRMLHKAISLRKPIERCVDELKAKSLRLTDAEWQQAEVLLMFLLPFQRCTVRFECNSSYRRSITFFFAYETMFNHLEDIKDKLKSGSGIGGLPCTKYILKVIEKMEAVLRTYYAKTDLPTVYSDGMILNPRCKLAPFEEETWRASDAVKYSNALQKTFRCRISKRSQSRRQHSSQRRQQKTFGKRFPE